MTRVLLTSFEPFDRQQVNASLEVGQAVARRPPDGVELHWLVLPVVAGVCVEQAWRRVEEVKPELVLALGQAASAWALRVETRAVNRNHFRIADNAGNQPRQQRIAAAGPAAYRATIPTRRLVRALRQQGLLVQLSGSAGTFVCNHLLYGLLHRAVLSGRPQPTGFIHLPLLPEQARRPEQMHLPGREQAAEAVRLAIAALLAPGPAVTSSA